jgi:hypothetical protein
MTTAREAYLKMLAENPKRAARFQDTTQPGQVIAIVGARPNPPKAEPSETPADVRFGSLADIL